MKNIILTDEAHMAEAEIAGVVFERGVAQALPDDVAAEVLKNPWCAEVAPEPASAPAPKADAAPLQRKPLDGDAPAP
jgi:hypothetical protein